MESYIVRIYRRAGNKPEDITGVVEKPDNGENITFNNVEALFNIFVPPRIVNRQNKQKQVFEQRGYRRFFIKEGTLLFDSTTDVGEISDISMGGLSFSSHNMPEDFAPSLEVGILCADKKYCTENIQCRNIICRSRTDSSASADQGRSRRFSVEFGVLTPYQRHQLENIIQDYTMGEV